MSSKYAPAILPFLLAAIILSTPLRAQQAADTMFNPRVSAPAFKEGTGPSVLIDKGHYDLHTLDGRIRFARSDGSLDEHPVTQGRNPQERIDPVIGFTGQAFRLEGQGQALMTLGRNVVLLMPVAARQFSKVTPSLSASGQLQGAIVQFGKGRVAVFGEAAMFSAQFGGPNRVPTGCV